MTVRLRSALALLCAAALVPLAVLVVAGGGTASVAAPSQRVSNANGAVVWEVNESTKEVTVTVRFAFSLVTTRITEVNDVNQKETQVCAWYTNKGVDGDCFKGRYKRETVPVPNPPNPRAVDRAITRIAESIQAAWDSRAFGCYRLRVKLNVRLVPGPEATKSDEIYVALDDAVVPNTRNHRIGYLYEAAVWANTETDYLSDSPRNRGDPVAGPSGQSKWPLAGAPDNYQHEFGHIIGLDDNYVDWSESVRPGAPEDIMFNQREFGLSWRSVAKAIRRSGLDIDKMGCAWRYLLPTSLMFPYTPNNSIALNVVLCKVPLPWGDPRVHLPVRFGRYSGDLKGSANLGKLGRGRGAGPIAGDYLVTDESLDVWELDVFLASKLRVQQRLRVTGDSLVAIGSPVFPELGVLGAILGPEPALLPLFKDPPECGS